MITNNTKSITINADSTIDGKIAAHFNCIIDSSNPGDITLSSYQTDKALYKKNRVQCRKDEAEFEDACYTLQDQLMSENSGSDASDTNAKNSVG